MFNGDLTYILLSSRNKTNYFFLNARTQSLSNSAASYKLWHPHILSPEGLKGHLGLKDLEIERGNSVDQQEVIKDE